MGSEKKVYRTLVLRVQGWLNKKDTGTEQYVRWTYTVTVKIKYPEVSELRYIIP
jgi:hypothetical protein